jgi:hypothetical protein
MAITPLPPAPQPSDSTSEFNSKAFAFVGALDGFVTQTNALALEVESDALDAAASEAAAAISVTEAENAASASASSANFKGEWSTLSGALAIPASVSQNGTIWVLTESVANVATEVPGVSSKWIAATFSTGKAIAMAIVFGG